MYTGKIMRKLTRYITSLALTLVFYSSIVVADGLDGISAVTTDNIEWNVLPDGRATAKIHGDMQTGEHITYIRFPASLRTAPHIHTSTYTGIILKGTARHFETTQEESAEWLLPGSFYEVPSGVPHISECDAGSECIFVIHQHEAFDRGVVE
jgi:hypothetical protein